MNTIEANQRLHASLANTYKTTEPHYRPENVRRVDRIIKNLKRNTQSNDLVDLGCGQGFIIDIAAKYFGNIVGVDITKEMTDRIDCGIYGSNITIKNETIEHVSEPDGTFGVCTAYAVLHHLEQLEPVFREAYRLLRPNGIFYSGLDPNYYFFNNLAGIGQNKSSYVQRELRSCERINSGIQEQAEPFNSGLREEHIKNTLTDIGFSAVFVDYDWFLGEPFMVGTKKEKLINVYLKSGLPMTRNLFKYVSIRAWK